MPARELDARRHVDRWLETEQGRELTESGGVMALTERGVVVAASSSHVGLVRGLYHAELLRQHSACMGLLALTSATGREAPELWASLARIELRIQEVANDS